MTFKLIWINVKDDRIDWNYRNIDGLLPCVGEIEAD